MDYYKYHCKRFDRLKLTTYQKIHEKWYVPVPGHSNDKYNRPNLNRFEKWYKLPDKAHRLFWRFHK